MARRTSPSVPPYRAQLALLVSEAPEGEGWVHEVKYDGYRIGCALQGGRATLWSRRGNDWTAALPEVAAAARGVGARSALLDGEVAALLPDGRTSFQALQNAFSGGARPPLAYFVFDLLHLDGEDLGRRPLLERKAALRKLIGGGQGLVPGSPSPRGAGLERGLVRYAPHVSGGGAAVFREACRLGLEGIVSKRADQPYRPGRNGGWVKVKCVLRQELVIGGFTEPEGAARDGIGALLVGFHEGGSPSPRGAGRGRRLRFAGKVGTGFTNAQARALRARLDRLAARDSPFTPPPAGRVGRNARWVRPRLVCEVAFTEWTADGHLRHPSFQGLREDKRAEEVVRERPRASAPGRGPGPGPELQAPDSSGSRSRSRSGSRSRPRSTTTTRTTSR